MFTRHGQHQNYAGKEELGRRISQAIAGETVHQTTTRLTFDEWPPLRPKHDISGYGTKRLASGNPGRQRTLREIPIVTNLDSTSTETPQVTTSNQNEQRNDNLESTSTETPQVTIGDQTEQRNDSVESGHTTQPSPSPVSSECSDK